jgi:hypothetical protein
MLWLDDHRGVYIPRDFASSFADRKGHLLVYRNDSDDAVLVLVVGTYPRFWLIGWTTAANAKRVGTWKDTAKTPCYWVHQSDLREISAATVAAVRRRLVY